MNKKICLFLLLLLPFSFGQAVPAEFTPNTAGEMTADIILEAGIKIVGTAETEDWMEIKFLTFNDWETQSIESISEELKIGSRVFLPEYKTEKENKFAVFKVENLEQFGANPEFSLVVNARIKTQSKIGLEKDFDLSSTLREKTDFLEATENIEVNAQELKSKANLEFQSNSELESIRQITEWVNTNIEYDFENYYSDVFSAKETYQNKAGVCDEFANLTAAFLRIKGIPAQYITGISFDGKVFGNHGWLEAFLPGTGWIGVDSTYGEAGYVDAAHIIQGKGMDASEIKNLVITTHSSSGELEIISSLKEPIVEIVSIQFLKDMVEIELKKPEELNLNQEFEIETIISNKHNKELLVPVSLHVHEDFSIENQKRVIWLKPLEKKTVYWSLISPLTGQTGFFANYDIILQLPDQKIKEKITVFPEESSEAPTKKVKIKDISPIISENNLEIRITIQNQLSEEKTIEFVFTHNAEEQKFIEDIPAQSQEEMRFSIANILPGEVKLQIGSPIEKNYSISIPKQETNQEPVVTIQEENSPNTQENALPLEEQGIFDEIIRFFNGIIQGLQNIFSGQ